jgi:hypothetical protein
MFEQIIAAEMITEHHEIGGESTPFPDKSHALRRQAYYNLVEAIESDLKASPIPLKKPM